MDATLDPASAGFDQETGRMPSGEPDQEASREADADLAPWSTLDPRPPAESGPVGVVPLDLGLDLDRVASAPMPALPIGRGPLRAVAIPLPLRHPHIHWGQLTISIVKGFVLLNVAAIILLLAAYTGFLHVLPATPPAPSVVGIGRAALAQRGTYCWFTPGHAICRDVDTSTIPSASLPQATVRTGASLRLTFAYPGPTVCTVSATDLAHPQKGAKTLGTLRNATYSWQFSAATYQLPVGLAAGTYRLDLQCGWNPPQSQRWLKGQGDAAYVLAVRVVAP